jgi:hypothetical protein
MAPAGPARAWATNPTGAPLNPSTVALALRSRAAVPSVHAASAKPPASVVPSAGSTLPDGVLQWTDTPACGTPPNCTWIRRGAASAVPTTPVWLELLPTAVAVSRGGTAVARNDTGDPCAPAIVLVAVMGPGSVPRVQTADAIPVPSVALVAGTIVPADARQVTATPFPTGLPSDITCT